MSVGELVTPQYVLAFCFFNILDYEQQIGENNLLTLFSCDSLLNFLEQKRTCFI